MAAVLVGMNVSCSLYRGARAIEYALIRMRWPGQVVSTGVEGEKDGLNAFFRVQGVE